VKAVVQRAKNASVKVENAVTGSIGSGLLVYLGVAREDSEKDAEWMAEKIANLRIFEDEQGKMNLSLLDIVAHNKTADATIGVLAVSQFTLLADASKGRRPYYGEAADPEKANGLYECFMEKIRERGLVCEAGVFQAHMDVTYTNDGPVTIILDSP
jgi:D-aminoacyl-tRNA deacylase